MRVVCVAGEQPIIIFFKLVLLRAVLSKSVVVGWRHCRDSLPSLCIARLVLMFPLRCYLVANNFSDCIRIWIIWWLCLCFLLVEEDFVTHIDVVWFYVTFLVFLALLLLLDLCVVLQGLDDAG